MTISIDKDRSEKLFERKWEEYVDDFCSQPSKELEALKSGKLLEPQNKNILGHLLRSRKIAELLCDLLGVKGSEKEDVVSAATIHDSFVLEEKAYVRQKSKQGIDVNFLDLQTIKTQSAKKLKGIGFPEKVINLTNENITHEEGGPKDLPEMIIFYTDAILSGSDIVDVPKRFDLTRRGWRSDLGVFDEETRKGNEKYWKEFFNGAPGHGNRSHDVVQLETAKRISKEFVAILKGTQEDTKGSKYRHIFGPDGDMNQLPYYLEEKLIERIINT